MRILRILILVPTILAAAAQKNNPASLQQLSRDSALIFSGVVLNVEHLEAGAASPAITRITFQVENGIRGVRRGQVIQIREWNLLWNAGERYRTGEHLLLFLYPNSKLGLTSPVGGRSGRFPVDAVGHITIRDDDGQRRTMKTRKFAEMIRRAVRE